MKGAKQLEEKLIAEGLVTSDQLKKARADAAKSGRTVRQSLVELKFLKADTLAQRLSHELQIPKVELKSYIIDAQVLALVPEQLARKHQIIPLFKVGDTVTVATADPLNLIALDEVRLRIGKTVEPVVATSEEVARALEEYYGAKGQLEELVSDLGEEKAGHKLKAGGSTQELEGLVSDPPIVRLVNLLLGDAVQQRASDIHLQAEKDHLRVRFRVDGLLQDFTTFPKHLEAGIIARVKVLASLNIAERRKPQDGRFQVSMEGRDLDLRVSVMPAIDGEVVVLRLLNSQGLVLNLDQLGMEDTPLKRYQELIKRSWGILLVTGPTGSGKTTTLYASLAELNSLERNIITIEDPVEYQLPGARQIPVNSAVELTFATGLRSILRQDPDVIMVGEIRDRETAEIAIQSALTGHLVFSTLHTNDAPTAVTRLLDMGIEPFLVASSVIGIVAQRLVRSVCPECAKPDPAQAEAAQRLGLIQKGNWMKGKGCRKCGKTGFSGRRGIFEVMPIDDAVGRLILAKAPASQIREQATTAGMTSLKQDGLSKAAQGLTTIDEVLRVSQA